MESFVAIAVLIPCFNEERTIGIVVADYKKLLPQATIYVYDNNSTDNTALYAQEAGAIVVPEYRQGKGFVIRSMFSDINADVYLMADGDDTYSAKDIVGFIEPVIAKQADMVIGDRLSTDYFTENTRMFHNAGNRIVRWLINFIFGSNVHDVMTGARAFSPRFVKSFPILSPGFEIETEMTIHALDKNFLIKEMPVGYKDRPEESTSKLNTLPDGLRVLKTIFALFKDFRPLMFFGSCSFALCILSFILFLRPFDEYLLTGYVTTFPTLIVAMSLFICALLSIVCGVILDSIRKQTRTFYELDLKKIIQEESGN